MKLAVAVLSSILLVCSVTTASPVNPSAAKNTGASTSTFIPSENGIGLGALDDPIPDSGQAFTRQIRRDTGWS
ncbi:hypothetical protein QVD99_005839 [Batrachochytrium dendrobatidis]|nr:hypothetical protein QVD99_005839 [Batrachochytrium dendrobatidis]